MAPASPPVERWEPAAADVDPDALVVGLAASLREWRPDQFTRFLGWFGHGADGEQVPLRCDHEPWLITLQGRLPRDVGRCLRFASVPPAGDFPGGLLVLAGLYRGFAPSILRDMRRGQWMAMSVGGVRYDADLWLVEVSLVARVGDQADPGALVIGTGRDAADAWELLTGG